MKKELKAKLNKKAVKRKLSCADARNVAEKLGISYRAVGAAAANELSIKLKNCEPGCF